MLEVKTSLDRRHFIIGAAMIGAAMGLTACSKPAETTEDDVAEAQSYDVYDTKTCDVVVVGGGISGLSAAVQAAQLGGSVILVEKFSQVGGNSRMAEGPFAVDSPMQRDAGIDLNAYDAIKNEMEFSNYRADAKIWTNFLKASGDNISWLMDNGVPFSGVEACNAGLEGWHKYDGGGTAAVDAMLATAQSLGVEILVDTPMLSLIDADGKVGGIIAEDSQGNLAIESKAVILAAGGTGANVATLSERTGFDCSQATVNCNPGNTGDSIDVSSKFNAATRTACIMGDKCVYGFDMFDHLSFAATRQPILWVNGYGERFVNEGLVKEDIPSAFNAIFISQDSCYSIMDQGTVDSFEAGNAPDPISFYFGGSDELIDLKPQIEKALSNGFGNAFKADTVAELAEAMGADPDTLVATVDRYNELCDVGEDPDFYKKAEYLLPLKTSPFYAFKMDPLIVCAIGGLVTDVNNNVLDADKKPIEGLYAVGLDGCNLYEETYNMMLGGSCNGYCVYSGRNAANNALA